jgi:hypothetical protein
VLPPVAEVGATYVTPPHVIFPLHVKPVHERAEHVVASVTDKVDVRATGFIKLNPPFAPIVMTAVLLLQMNLALLLVPHLVKSM